MEAILYARAKRSQEDRSQNTRVANFMYALDNSIIYIIATLSYKILF